MPSTESAFAEPVRVVSGEFEIGTQHHFHLETHTTLVRPIEDGQYEIYCATQWISQAQKTIAKALGIPLHNLDMKVRRLGGGYGGKIENPLRAAAAAAIAASRLRRPVRIVMDLKQQMESVGKRLPYMAKYRVGSQIMTLLRPLSFQIMFFVRKGCC